MVRTLPLCALLFLLPCAADADEAPTQTIVRLTVTPQAAPTPALRYQLLPELREMNPGNPVQGFLTCFMEENNFFFGKEENENREKWKTMPLKELPLKELHSYGGVALRQADYAARLDKLDWQLLLKFRRDGFNVIFPDLQVMRRLAEALKVRFRVEIAERRFDDALSTAKTMFALSYCVGKHPSFIGDLVSGGIGLTAVGPVEEMIQQPGCPNLYWALTDLPAPFIDLHEGMQGERDIAFAEFQMLEEKGPMSAIQVKQALDHIGTLIEYMQPPKFGLWAGGPSTKLHAPPPAPPKVEKMGPESKDEASDWVAARAGDAEGVQAARKRLVELGFAEEAVKQFPVVQVILLDEKYKFIIRSDEELKFIALPYWEVEKLLTAPPKKRSQELFASLTVGVLKVRQYAVRFDQRLALLRCVEALRIYAAENAGRLPAKLSDVQLPLPLDPVTGKPFPYQLDGATATLRGTPPAGREKDAAFNICYEVTIVK